MLHSPRSPLPTLQSPLSSLDSSHSLFILHRTLNSFPTPRSTVSLSTLYSADSTLHPSFLTLHFTTFHSTFLSTLHTPLSTLHSPFSILRFYLNSTLHPVLRSTLSCPPRGGGQCFRRSGQKGGQSGKKLVNVLQLFRVQALAAFLALTNLLQKSSMVHGSAW